jgi:hypothetical protein
LDIIVVLLSDSVSWDLDATSVKVMLTGNRKLEKIRNFQNSELHKHIAAFRGRREIKGEGETQRGEERISFH